MLPNRLLILLALILAPCAARAADEPLKLPEPKPLNPGHKVVLLFPLGHPALKALEGPDQQETWTLGKDGHVTKVNNINNPSIELYLAPPDKANGMSVILSPGGGNKDLWVGPEGVDVANWLNTLGVSCFVHRYRLKPYGSATDALAETQRAVRIVRANAKEWNIDPNKIGHMGFSAGGEQTARLALTFDAGKPDAADPIDRVSSRPDFMILGYPVITLKDPYAHKGSRTYLLGENPDPSLVALLSNETQVTKDTPPTFLVHTSNDRTVPVENSIMFYQALHAAGVPAEMHIFESGPHGFGLGTGNPVLSTWPAMLANWLRARGLLSAGG